MIVRAQGDWLTAEIGNELVMMSTDSGVYIGLSEVAARIWELVQQPRAMDDLCAQLADEFEVAPETCRAETEDFLRQLERHGAVLLDAPAAG